MHGNSLIGHGIFGYHDKFGFYNGLPLARSLFLFQFHRSFQAGPSHPADISLQSYVAIARNEVCMQIYKAADIEENRPATALVTGGAGP